VGDDYMGYRPDHYGEYVPDDSSRLGGTMGEEKARPADGVLLRTHFKVSGVFLFTNKVVIIDDQGGITVVDRYNGTIRTA